MPDVLLFVSISDLHFWCLGRGELFQEAPQTAQQGFAASACDTSQAPPPHGIRPPHLFIALGTSASLVVTSALLVVTRSY